MKGFSEAYSNSKVSVNSAKQEKIDKEKAMVLEAIKQEFGVSSFKTVSDAEKKAFKSLILEYWDPRFGLTKSGLAYINDGIDVVNESSTNGTVKKHFKRLITPFLRAWAEGRKTPAEVEDLIKEALLDVRESGAKLKNGTVSDKNTAKGIIAETMLKLISAQITSFKL